MPTKTVGILHSGEQAKQRQSVAWFKNELARWVRGTSITINYDPADALWSDDRRALLDQNARTLATNANLNLIIAAGGSRSVFALQQAQSAAGTSTPVVFTTFYNTTSPATNMCGVCPHTSDKDVDRLTNFRTRFPASSYGVLQNRSRFDYDPTNAKFVAWANANVPLNYQTDQTWILGRQSSPKSIQHSTPGAEAVSRQPLCVPTRFSTSTVRK
jgi:hypothetical protein